MGTLEILIVIAGLSLGTFLVRVSFLVLLAGRELSARQQRFLALAVPAILSALVLPLVVLHEGKTDLLARWPYIGAALASGAVALWRGGGMVLPLSLGMATLHGLLWLAR